MLGWLGLTAGKPQGRSLCVWGVASGSAASHPDPGSSGMVEFSEESRYSRPVPNPATTPRQELGMVSLRQVSFGKEEET